MGRLSLAIYLVDPFLQVVLKGSTQREGAPYFKKHSCGVHINGAGSTSKKIPIVFPRDLNGSTALELFFRQAVQFPSCLLHNGIHWGGVRFFECESHQPSELVAPVTLYNASFPMGIIRGALPAAFFLNQVLCAGSLVNPCPGK